VWEKRVEADELYTRLKTTKTKTTTSQLPLTFSDAFRDWDNGIGRSRG
jgi:hypothetical protein